MDYKKGDLVILDTTWNADTLFTIVGRKNTLYNWYLLKHLYPPHPFGGEKFFIHVAENDLWKFPLGEINELIERKQRVPIDVWNYIMSFIIRKQDRHLLFN